MLSGAIGLRIRLTRLGECDPIRASVWTRRTRLTDAAQSGTEDVGAKDDVVAVCAKPVDEFSAQCVDLRVQHPACTRHSLLSADELLGHAGRQRPSGRIG
jgi:hypothetical protein